MGDSHVGLQARLMSQALRKLTGIVSKSKTSLVFINQIREKVGVMFGSPDTTTGGRALKLYATVRLDIDQPVGRQPRHQIPRTRGRAQHVRHAAWITTPIGPHASMHGGGSDAEHHGASPPRASRSRRAASRAARSEHSGSRPTWRRARGRPAGPRVAVGASLPQAIFGRTAGCAPPCLADPTQLDDDRLGNVSSFVAVASQLILIKSRALLPRRVDLPPGARMPAHALLVLTRPPHRPGRGLGSRSIPRAARAPGSSPSPRDGDDPCGGAGAAVPQHGASGRRRRVRRKPR